MGDNQIDNNEKKETIFNAKGFSLIGMIVAVLIEIVFNLIIILKEKRVPDITEQQSITWLSASIIIFFSPVYLSIWLDKIFDLICQVKINKVDTGVKK